MQTFSYLFKIGNNRENKIEYWINTNEVARLEVLDYVFSGLLSIGCIGKNYTMIMIHKDGIASIGEHNTIDIKNDISNYNNPNRDSYFGVRVSNINYFVEYIHIQDLGMVQTINEFENRYVNNLLTNKDIKLLAA